MERGV